MGGRSGKALPQEVPTVAEVRRALELNWAACPMTLQVLFRNAKTLDEVAGRIRWYEADWLLSTAPTRLKKRLERCLFGTLSDLIEPPRYYTTEDRLWTFWSQRTGKIDAVRLAKLICGVKSYEELREE